MGQFLVGLAAFVLGATYLGRTDDPEGALERERELYGNLES